MRLAMLPSPTNTRRRWDKYDSCGKFFTEIAEDVAIH